MKNIRIVHGTLLYPLEVGSRALIFEEGRYLHTSTTIKQMRVYDLSMVVHGETFSHLRSLPVAADVPVSVMEQAA